MTAEAIKEKLVTYMDKQKHWRWPVHKQKDTEITFTHLSTGQNFITLSLIATDSEGGQLYFNLVKMHFQRMLEEIGLILSSPKINTKKFVDKDTKYCGETYVYPVVGADSLEEVAMLLRIK